ncbi:MAG: AMP-binding protein [Nitratireductor sp.]|nr:AMP-binding protein [Nitratireductor sp.]
MFDLGRTLAAAVDRDPGATAIVDGDLRLDYAGWFQRICNLAGGLGETGLRHGDRLLTALQNNHAAASIHWACQMAGITIVPVNWRVTAEELDFFIENSGAKALMFDASSIEAVAASKQAATLPLIAHEATLGSAVAYADMAVTASPVSGPVASAQDWSVMLYTSGTTARPKGVPRRHRAERAGAVAHIAQNMMPSRDRTLGVMPLYHTMGVRSLIVMTLLGGCFVCLPRFNAATALRLIEEERIASLYLVPTLYHDLLADSSFASTDLSGVRRLGFAGASMTDGLLKKINEAFAPELFVNHYGSSEIYTFTIEQDAVRKPGSAGKAGLNQHIRVVEMDARDPDRIAPAGTEGQIIASMRSDEAFESYWQRPDADEKSIIGGWYFTGDSGRFDEDGDLFVTGRVDDMIITGGENVSPVEVESCLSLHPAVDEAAVVGLPDERWGKTVTAFVKRKQSVSPQELDEHCRNSGLANFKRPRRIVFVTELPKSPVGKLLRRHLVAGEYKPEPDQSAE